MNHSIKKSSRGINEMNIDLDMKFSSIYGILRNVNHNNCQHSSYNYLLMLRTFCGNSDIHSNDFKKN